MYKEFTNVNNNNNYYYYIILFNLGIGDWGLGIGQSPIPNPQSPINLCYITKPLI